MIDVKNLAKNKHQDKNSRQSLDLVDIRHIQIDKKLSAYASKEK